MGTSIEVSGLGLTSLNIPCYTFPSNLIFLFLFAGVTSVIAVPFSILASKYEKKNSIKYIIKKNIYFIIIISNKKNHFLQL